MDAPTMTGTENQIQWAEQIKPAVAAEFERIRKAFEAVAAGQPEADQEDTLAILAIIEEKRIEVMSNQSAGYFIQYWRELGDQVRWMILHDERYMKISVRSRLRKKPIAF